MTTPEPTTPAAAAARCPHYDERIIGPMLPDDLKTAAVYCPPCRMWVELTKPLPPNR